MGGITTVGRPPLWTLHIHQRRHQRRERATPLDVLSWYDFQDCDLWSWKNLLRRVASLSLLHVVVQRLGLDNTFTLAVHITGQVSEFKNGYSSNALSSYLLFTAVNLNMGVALERFPYLCIA